MKLAPDIPIVFQFIHLIKEGLTLLEPGAREEIKEFVRSRQHQEGGFTGRSENTDLYYSLFGFWLARALEMTQESEKLQLWIRNYIPDRTNPINFLAYKLICIQMEESSYNRLSFLKILKILFQKKTNISFQYRLFLSSLVFDIYPVKRKLFYFFSRPWLLFIEPPDKSPCSIHAAWLVARLRAGISHRRATQKLYSFFENGKGFKMFEKSESADILSTGVALFALKSAGQDLRLVVPDCLNLLKENFSSGAFFAGNGDMIRDLEYTFYGLLALGAMA